MWWPVEKEKRGQPVFIYILQKQSTYLSDDVRMVVLHNGSGERAVRGVLGHNLRNGDLGGAIGGAVVIAVVSRGGNSREGNSDDGGETHFDRWVWVWVRIYDI